MCLNGIKLCYDVVVCPVMHQMCCLVSVRNCGDACRTPALAMEWAVFEAKAGKTAKARQLFLEGSKMEPQHPPLLAAWAAFEASQQQWEEANRIQILADAGSMRGAVPLPCLHYTPFLSTRHLKHYKSKEGRKYDTASCC